MILGCWCLLRLGYCRIRHLIAAIDEILAKTASLSFKLATRIVVYRKNRLLNCTDSKQHILLSLVWVTPKSRFSAEATSVKSRKLGCKLIMTSPNDYKICCLEIMQFQRYAATGLLRNQQFFYWFC